MTKEFKSQEDVLVEGILLEEGGYQVSEKDTGNFNSSGELVGTNYGISAPVYEEYLGRPVTRQDMEELPVSVASKIYKKNYIQPVIKNLGIPIDSPAFKQVLDMTVNHGYGNTTKMLQNMLGLEQDGKSGNMTRDAIKQSMKASKSQFNNDLVSTRKNFYNEIVAADPRQKDFLQGWINRAERFRMDS